jgi:Beta-lactamase enzyme family
MALWLWRYQSRTGTVPDNLPYSIRYLLQNMITTSDNVAANSLFYFSGGCTTLTLFNTLIPTRHTMVGCETRPRTTGGATPRPRPRTRSRSSAPSPIATAPWSPTPGSTACT